VLRAAHLAYYKSSAEYEPLRLLELADVHSCTQINLKKHDNTFGLVSAARIFYLQAKTEAEVKEWTKAIEDARQAVMATSTQNSTSGSISVPNTRSHDNSHPIPPLTPSPPRHRPFHTHNITSSDSDEASPHVVHPRPRSPHAHPVSSSPTKSHFHASDPAKTVLSGYLMKCDSKRRNWRKRWFILTGEHLMYSASHMVS
jgi:pleckstrin homology domain-containing family A member 1/2